MKKILILYILILFTACTANESSQWSESCHRHPIKEQRQQNNINSSPGIAISIIVNPEVALYEMNTTSTIESNKSESDPAHVAPFDLQ
jgi:hypothetical protein